MVHYPEAAARKCSVNKMFLQIHGKAPLLKSLFNKVAGPEACRACNFIKKRLRYSFFPMSFATFLRIHFFTKQLRWLLLIVLNDIILYRTRMAHLCQEEFPRLYTDLANLYFLMTLINFVPKSHCRIVKFSF